MSIVEFLEARLSEDEAAARVLPDSDMGPPPPGRAFWVDTMSRPIWEPRARALREVAAKRAIVAGPDAFVLEHWRAWVLGHLASVYADHPDYDQAWCA